MYIHLGEKKIISDKTCIGIFNAETICLSEENDWILSQISSGDKSIAVTESSEIICSKVSPFTVQKRTIIENDLVWRRNND